MKTGEVTLPIAETFHSVQGEGEWVGTPMHFIRLAGCPVGRPAKAVKMDSPLPLLPTGAPAMVCSSWDGRQFWCDTDYNRHDVQSLAQLIEQTYERHICLTGGEPLVHQRYIPALCELARSKDIRIHIESSGTIKLDMKLYRRFWLTIAPKIACLDEVVKEADEVKLLVDEHFRADRLTKSMLNHPNVFLCPINDIDTVRKENVQLCLELLQQFPQWRLSCQVHKFLGLR